MRGLFLSRARLSAAIVMVCALISSLSTITHSQEAAPQVLEGGSLRGVTILSADDGIYVDVTGPVTIEVGSSLTLRKGLVLRFQPGSGVHSLGRFRVEGTEKDPVILRPEDPANLWQGIHISGLGTRGSILQHVIIEGPDIGVKVTGGASLKARDVTVKSAENAGMLFTNSVNVDLYNCNITETPQESCGICVIGGSNFKVDGCDVDRGAGHTIGIRAQNVDNISVKNCKISSGSALGLNLEDVSGNVTIEDSTFPTNVGGSLIQTDVNKNCFVSVNRIRFSSVGFSGHCLKIVSLGNFDGTVSVTSSVIYGCDSAVALTVENKSVTLSGNQMYLNHQALDLSVSHKQTRVLLTANAFIYNSNDDRTPAVNVKILPKNFEGSIQIYNNLFQQNQCKFTFQVLNVVPCSPKMQLTILDNKFVLNSIDPQVTGDKAVLMLKLAAVSDHFLFANNSFQNPALQYDFAVGGTSIDHGYVLDASRNFWDDSRKSILQVEERVLANHIDPSRAVVLLEPFILTLEPYILSSMCDGATCDCPPGYGGPYCLQPNCLDVQNCTMHGDCIAPNACKCLVGWTGLSCDEPVCLEDCTYGTCVAPDVCNCSEGWSGETCDIRVCNLNCSNHGTCGSTGDCVCDEGWSGNSCGNATCSTKFNCSEHGICVEVDECDCFYGWAGDDCSIPDCSELQRCNNNGNCSLNQTCLCLPGWYGESCTESDCSSQLNCLGHGRCVEPNSCDCNKGYTGQSCEQCSENFWGLDCLPCPECHHGTCHEKGFCSCEGPNWTGTLCDRCSESFYGSNCLPLPSVTELLPNAGPPSGGTVVHAKVDNMPNSTFTCRFGDEEVIGVRLDESTVKCTSPPNPSGVVAMVIIGENFTVLNSANFTYFSDCPLNSCGENQDPSRGSCILGVCACNPPWSDKNCSSLQLAPDIARISSLKVREFQDFTYQFELLGGTEPVAWSLYSNVTNIHLDANEGILTWENVQLDLKFTTVILSAHNGIGSDNETVQINIEHVYKVTSLHIDQSGPFSSPTPIKVSGEIESYILSNETLPPSFPVLIRIKHRNLTRTIKTTAESGSLKFEQTFYPSPTDIGTFTADACHPADTDYKEMVSWVVMGLRISPVPLTLTGTVGERLSGPVTLTNLGLNPLTNLKYYLVKENITSIDVTVTSAARRDIPAEDMVVTELNSEQPLELNLTIQADYPGNFSLTIIIDCSEGINASLPLELVIEELGPVLELSPAEINTTMLRGKERTVEVRIKNIGSKTAYDLNTQVSSNDLVFVLAFDKLDVEDFDYKFLDLEPGQSAMMIVLVNPQVEHDIGWKSDSIVMQSMNVESTLWLNTYVLSDLRLNLTIVVIDDTKCSAEMNSGLKMAAVLLSNKARSFHVEESTNDFGEVLIVDLPEDYYELTVTALNHKPKTEVIFVTPDNYRVTIQLETMAVNLSWAISDDRSAEQLFLKSDFPANSPFPVVIVEPSTVDLGALEQGEIDVLNLLLNNHGLAIAEDVIIILPQHQFLTFSMVSTKLGDLPANSSVMAVIEVNRMPTDNETHSIQGNSELKKNGTDSHLLIKIKYSHSCVETIKREVDVILMRSGNRSAENPDGVADIPELDYSIPLVQSVFCDSCLLSVSQCLEPILLTGSWRDCSLTIFGRIERDSEPYGSVIGQFLLLLELFFTCGKIPGQVNKNETENFQNIETNSTINATTSGCLDIVKRDCHENILRSLELPQLGKRQDLAPIAAYRRLVIQELYDLRQYVVPQSWYTLSDSKWFHMQINPVLAITGDGGMLVTEEELASLLQTRIPSGLTTSALEGFLLTLNTSLFNWQTGDLNEGNGSLSYSEISSSIQPLFKGLGQMLEDGFSDPLTWYSQSLTDIKQAPETEESCAKAKLRLSQKSVQTNQSLSVTLEIENGDITSLLDLVLKLKIYQEDDGRDTIDLFDIDTGIRQGFDFEDDNSTMVLPLVSAGSQSWKVTPFESSTSTGSQRYRINAEIEHTLKGKTLNVFIKGEVFTVTASPRIEVHYFYPHFPPQRLYPKDKNQTDSPTVSVVVKNAGASVIRDLKIVTAQLTISKGKSDSTQRCRIQNASVRSKVVSSMYELSLGDLEAYSIVLASWHLQCDHPAKVKTFKLSFVQTNAIGDTVLCNPEREFLHEVLHEVRVDNPADDLISDLLVFGSAENLTYPDKVISTNKDLSSTSVSTTEEFELHEIASNDKMTELQMLVEAYREGWNWLKIPFNLPANQELKKVRRQDGKNLILQYNVWLTETVDQRYINLFDWFATPSWDVRRKRQATSFNSYYLLLGIKNKPPTFQKAKYQASISEGEKQKATILSCPASDEDNEITYYELEGADTGSIPFGVTEFGEIVLVGALDRESIPVYRLKLTAYDNGEPSQSATAVVGINILDENDNDPVFEESSYSITIKNTVSLNSEILKVKAFDPDEGENGTVVYCLAAAVQVPFRIDGSNGAIFTSEMLSSQSFTFEVSASNGNRSTATTVQVIVNVLHSDTVSQIFSENVTDVIVSEDLSVGTQILQIFSPEEIPDAEVQFEFLSDVPFELNTFTGYVEVKSALDRETRDYYNFTVRVKDDSPFEKEIELEEIIILINVTDINDNAPLYSPPTVQLHVKEDARPSDVIQTLSFSDADFGVNGTLAVCKFADHDYDMEAMAYFSLNATAEEVDIHLINDLDRENSSHFNFEILAVDGGEPSLTGTVTLVVTVEDVNDNPPVFEDTPIVVNISKLLPINSRLLTIRARDKDLNNSLTYRFNDSSHIFKINRDTGVVTLSKSLEIVPEVEFEVLTIVSDGMFDAHTTLTFRASQDNSFAPVFEKDLHKVEIKETSLPGTFVEILLAEDADGDWVTYFIHNGDPYEVFHVDSVSGEIMTQYPLDVAENANFTLTVGARDGKKGDARTRVGYTTVEILIIKVNQFAPFFPAGETIYAEILENSPLGTVFQFQGAIDEDQDLITYSFSSHEERFLISPEKAEISTLIPIDREIKDSYMLHVKVTDDGVPRRSTDITLLVNVTDINDNPPLISDIQTNVTILLTAVRLQIPAFQVTASDPDKGNNSRLSYFLITHTPLLTISEATGAIFCTESCLAIKENLTWAVTIKVTDNGNPQHEFQASTTFHFVAFPSVSALDNTTHPVDNRTEPNSTEAADHSPSTMSRDEMLSTSASTFLTSTELQNFATSQTPFDTLTSEVSQGRRTETVEFPTSESSREGSTSHVTFSSTTKALEDSDERDSGYDKQDDDEDDTDDNQEDTDDDEIDTDDNQEDTDDEDDDTDDNQEDTDDDEDDTDDNQEDTDDEDDDTDDNQEDTDDDEDDTDDNQEDTGDEDDDTDDVSSEEITATEMQTTPVITSKPLPTPELPLDQYKELCRTPIDAVMADRAGIFFFQGNYVWKLPQKRRWVVRGYPKTTSRVFAGWWKKKIEGPITAAVHSEESEFSYLFKGRNVWIFSTYRLVGITPLTGPDTLTQVDTAIVLPGKGIYLIQGTSAYALIEGEDDIKAANPTPVQEILPGAPSTIDGAFTSFAGDILYLFSNQLVYEWELKRKMFSEGSPCHITEWMNCVDS